MSSSPGNAPTTAVMSGGAPQSPLMAGFLYAMWDAERTFTKFHTSGAGALMALLFISPSKRFDHDPGSALRNWVEAGIADEIYRVMPQNFKLFHKPGPFAPVFSRLAERFKVPIAGVPSDGGDPVAEFLTELIAPLESYNSKLAASLRKDPIEQLRDLWRAMWLGSPTSELRDALLKGRDPIRRLREKWLTTLLASDEDRRLYNDMVDLFFAVLTPSTLSSKSLGLAAPLPFLEQIVDFDKLRANVIALGEGAHICVNAYNMTLDAKLRTERRKEAEQKEHAAHGDDKLAAVWETLYRDRCQERKEDLSSVMQLFYQPYEANPTDEERMKDGQFPITAQGIRAAFSMPFIYPPARIGNDYYSEGADHEPVNFRHAVERQEYPFVLLDVLGELEDHLVRKPRDLWDSYVISIMTPVVALANQDIAEFKAAHADWKEKMITVNWDIPTEAEPFVMDWSRSNLKTLFEVGEEAGRKFLNKYRDVLPRRPKIRKAS